MEDIIKKIDSRQKTAGFEPLCVMVYRDNSFGVFDIKEYKKILATGNKEPILINSCKLAFDFSRQMIVSKKKTGFVGKNIFVQIL